MALKGLFAERRTSIDADLDTAAVNEKRNHEILWVDLAKRAEHWRWSSFLQSLTILALCVVVFRLSGGHQYIPVAMGDRPDGRKYFLGLPDPTWKPDDHVIVPELLFTLRTIRGRTTDAKFDYDQWKEVAHHVTEAGLNSLRKSFQEWKDTPEKGRIEVKLRSIAKFSDNTYDLRWFEIRHNEKNQQMGPQLRFQGLFKVMIDVPRTITGLEANIAGVWHDGWSISEDKD